jgi:hypothetical protein
MDWIQLAQDSDQWQAFVNTAMNFQVPQRVGNFLISLKHISFSRGVLFYEAS